MIAYNQCGIQPAYASYTIGIAAPVPTPMGVTQSYAQAGFNTALLAAPDKAYKFVPVASGSCGTSFYTVTNVLGSVNTTSMLREFDRVWEGEQRTGSGTDGGGIALTQLRQELLVDRAGIDDQSISAKQ